MKKKVFLALAVSLVFAGAVSASSMWGQYKGNNIIRLTVDGVPTKVSDVPAIGYNGRTMVPIYLLQQAGVNYTWDQKTMTVDVKTQKEEDLREGAVLWMQLYVTLLDRHRELYEFGETISNHADDQTRAFESIQANASDLESSIKTARNTYDEAKEYYAEMSERIKLDDDWSEENGYPTEIETILAGYQESLDLLEDSLLSLEQHQKTKVDGDTFLKSIEAIQIQNDEFRNLAFSGYQDFYGYIQDFK